MAPSTRAVALVAAPLLVAGSVAGFLVAGGSLSEGLGLAPAAQDAAAPGTCSVPTASPFPSGAQVETWSGDVPAEAEGGTIVASGWWGGVHVAPSDGDTYTVEIAEVDDRDELEPKVTADVSDGVFSLKAVVEHTNQEEVGPATLSAGTDPGAEAHVKVRVPAKVYESIDADSTADDGVLVTGDNGTEATVHVHPRVDTNVQDNDSGVADAPVLVQGLEAGTITADAYNRPAGVAGVAGGSVHADSHNGRAVVENVDAGDNVSVDSYNGAACARSVQAQDLHLDSHNGQAKALDAEAEVVRLDSYNKGAIGEDLRASQVEADSHNGPARVDVTPTASGEVHADSYNGPAEVTVATGDAYGYDAYADAYNGDATVELPNATVTSEDDGKSHGGDGAHARTEGYDSRSIQVEVEASTHNGDALVTG